MPFVMELPNYRMPTPANVARLLWDKAKDFVERAFSVIFIATLLIWFLQTFSLRLNMVSDSKDSILAALAGVLTPLLKPLGFGDWRICVALIAGFMAKESVVSTLSVLFGSILCGGRLLVQKRAGRKVGSGNRGGAVPCGLDRRLYS